jgi:protein-S-isoprenylcysteine O-methyltransferase Ste14
VPLPDPSDDGDRSAIFIPRSSGDAPRVGYIDLGCHAFSQVRHEISATRRGSVLVTSGPFQFSRNPIYLGMLIWLIGLAILLGSLIAFAFPLIFFLLANFIVIPLEERDMECIFEARFFEYKRRVRRWF